MRFVLNAAELSGSLRVGYRLVKGSALRPSARRIDCVFITVNHVIVDIVFYEARRVWNTPDPLRIAFIFRKEKFIGVLAIEPVIAEQIVARLNNVEF